MKISIFLIFIVGLSLIPFSAFAQSIITLSMSSQNYNLGQPVIIQGLVNLSPSDPKGLPISFELHDPNGNIIDAGALPVTNNEFTYTIHTGDGTKVTGNGKFEVIVYYGNPNPMLLNTPQSSSILFTISNGQSVQGGLPSTITQEQASQQQSSFAQTSGLTTIDNTQGGIIVVVMLGILLGFLIYIKIISYPVEIVCTNCNHRFKRNIKKGVPFEKATRNRKCPNCKLKGYLVRYSDYERSS